MSMDFDNREGHGNKRMIRIRLENAAAASSAPSAPPAPLFGAAGLADEEMDELPWRTDGDEVEGRSESVSP